MIDRDDMRWPLSSWQAFLAGFVDDDGVVCDGFANVVSGSSCPHGITQSGCEGKCFSCRIPYDELTEAIEKAQRLTQKIRTLLDQDES